MIKPLIIKDKSDCDRNTVLEIDDFVGVSTYRECTCKKGTRWDRHQVELDADEAKKIIKKLKEIFGI